MGTRRDPAELDQIYAKCTIRRVCAQFGNDCSASVWMHAIMSSLTRFTQRWRKADKSM